MSEVNELLRAHPELPFERTHIEEWGQGRAKRRDLTLLGKDLRACLKTHHQDTNSLSENRRSAGFSPFLAKQPDGV